jgi:methylmalonyl-CoA/ethylmalonyl-CoA epimerase
MQTAASFGLQQIGQISVTVHEVEKAVAFYRDSLGMRFLFQVSKMAFFDCGGVRLMLSLPETSEFDHPGSVLYYKVPNIREAFDSLSARGVQFIDEPHLVAPMPDHDLWMTFFHDPSKNTLALMSEVPRDPSSV